MKGEDGEYITCIFCGHSAKINGDTQHKRDAHMMVGLDTFLHKDCDNSSTIEIQDDGTLLIANTMTGVVRSVDAEITVNK